jgi:hypothetical protein
MLLPSQTITKSTENSTTYSTSNRVMAWQQRQKIDRKSNADNTIDLPNW